MTAMRHIAAMSPPTPCGLARTEVQVRTDLAAAYRLAALNGQDPTAYTHPSASVLDEPDGEPAYSRPSAASASGRYRVSTRSAVS